jgi:threonine/homoserine/homoserine lactone efflux protein
MANPKAWVAIAAVFASARLVHSAATDALAKAALLTGMIVVINTMWLLAGAAFAPTLRHPRRSRLVNGVLAVVLVAATAFAIAD